MNTAVYCSIYQYWMIWRNTAENMQHHLHHHHHHHNSLIDIWLMPSSAIYALYASDELSPARFGSCFQVNAPIIGSPASLPVPTHADTSCWPEDSLTRTREPSNAIASAEDWPVRKMTLIRESWLVGLRLGAGV